MGTTQSIQAFDSVTQTVSSNSHHIADTPSGVRDGVFVAKEEQSIFATLRRLTGCFANTAAITKHTSGGELPTAEAKPVDIVFVKPCEKEDPDITDMQVEHSATSSQDPHNMYAPQQNTRTASPKVNVRKRPFPGNSRHAMMQPRINGFVLEKSLQNGYSGKVFRGYEESTGAPVVVKCCRKLSSWQTETMALSQLHHENIIGMVGTARPNVPDTSSVEHNQFVHGRSSLTRTSMIGQENAGVNETNTGPQVHVLAQEYAANGDLYELLQSNGPVDEPTARALLIPIVNALHHAYNSGEGISHRDIKLENIFVADDGTVKVGDWGLAAFKTRNRQCTSSCGTLGYMAPEMVCREAYDSNKTDVWALAVVLFSLTTGVRPYAEPQARRKDLHDTKWRDEWLNAMITGRWKLWWSSHAKTTPTVRNMSSDLRDLLEQMFCGDSRLRASLSDVLDHPWMQSDYEEQEVTKHDIARLCRGY